MLSRGSRFDTLQQPHLTEQKLTVHCRGLNRAEPSDPINLLLDLYLPSHPYSHQPFPRTAATRKSYPMKSCLQAQKLAYGAPLQSTLKDKQWCVKVLPQRMAEGEAQQPLQGTWRGQAFSRAYHAMQSEGSSSEKLGE